MNWSTLPLGFLILMLIAACGGPPSSQVPDASLSFSTPPIEAEVELIVELDGETRALTARELFDEGLEREAKGAFEECAAVMDMLWRGLPRAHPLHSRGVYHAGLCLESGGDLDGAYARFEQLGEVARDLRASLDARLRLARIDAEREAWARVVERLDQVEIEHEVVIKPLDRLEVNFRMGMAMVALRRADDARRWFRKCLHENTMAGRGAREDRHEFVAGCHYGEALVEHMAFAALQFELPVGSIQRQRGEKDAQARKVYDRYDRVIRTKNRYWMMLAGYMIGKLYEDHYHDMLSAEIDPSIHGNAQALEAYFETLREGMTASLGEAIKIYRETGVINRQGNYRNPWGERALARAKWLEDYRDDEALRREQEAYLVAQDQALRAGELTHDPRRFNCFHDPLRPPAAAPGLASEREGVTRGELPWLTPPREEQVGALR